MSLEIDKKDIRTRKGQIGSQRWIDGALQALFGYTALIHHSCVGAAENNSRS